MIIGDIGINHNGSLQTAIELIDMAVSCGIDVVKFQKRTPTVCVPKTEWRKPRDTPWGRMSYIEYKERIEFGKHEYDIINDHCVSAAIDWTASVWDTDSLEFIMQYDVPFIKVASASICDHKLLNSIADYDVPVIMSAGMSTEKEIFDAVEILESSLETIMYCKSVYPSRDSDIHLQGIYRLRDMFPNIDIGYSGHEIGYLPSIMARTIGVKTFERHITLNCDAWGTDHKMSLDQLMLIDFMAEMKRVDAIMGDSKTIGVVSAEIPFREKMRHVA